MQLIAVSLTLFLSGQKTSVSPWSLLQFQGTSVVTLTGYILLHPCRIGILVSKWSSTQREWTWGTQSGKERLGQPGRVTLTYVDYHAVYGDCSHDIKGRSLLGRKAATNLDSMLESRDITLPTKVCLVKAMVFPAVMYSCESWTIKKAEHQRAYAFELWCWRRLLRVPWTARRSNQSILKEIISPGCSLEGLMLKLKLQYFGDLMWRTDSLEKTLMLGKIEGRRRRVRQRMRCLDSITESSDVNSRSCWWTGRPGVLQSMGSQRVRHDWATELNWPESGIFRSANKRKIWFTIMDTNRAFL